MAAIEPATDATAPPSTHDANTDDGAASERPDGQHDRPLGGRPHAASVPTSPSIMPMSPASGEAHLQQHSSAPASPMAMSPGGAAPHAPGLQHGCSLPPAASFPTSLRAGGRLYDPQSKRGMEAAPSMRTSVPLKRDLAYDIKIAKHAALLQAASLAAARIKSTGDLTPSSPGTGAAKLEWHTDGNELIGREIMRCVYDGASLAGMARAKVIGWLPASESDFEDALGRPQPLWLCRFSEGSLLEGEEEELERHELVESIDSSESQQLCAQLDDDDDVANDAVLSGDDEAEVDGLPGWVTEKRQLLNGRTYHVYRGPHGAYADSYGQAASMAGEYALNNDDIHGGEFPDRGGPPGGRRGKRSRCGQCATCKAEDCNACKFCKDKAKNGGANTLRRPCSARMPCLAPPQDDPSSILPGYAPPVQDMAMHDMLHTGFEPTAIATE
mmetsp:Transcript_13488/g.34429  ORF Transcript_13488/g.34429 Transcript_13488/m.34429 type:complete len:442 (-) Transcript_13488:326-1651(-)